MGLPDLQATIESLERAAEDARAATREAHEAVQALRRAERDARAAGEAVTAVAAKAVGERMAELVSEQLDMYRDQMVKAAHDGYANVRDQFDRMMNLCVYGNTQGRGEDIFERLRARALELDAIFGPPGDPELPALRNRGLHGRGQR